MEPTDVTLEILRKIQSTLSDLREQVAGNTSALASQRQILDQHTKILDQHTKTLDQHTKTLDQHTKILDQHTKILDQHTQQFESQGRRLESLEVGQHSHGRRLSAIERRLGELVDVTTLSVTRQLDLTSRMDALEGRVDALERR